MTEKTQENRQFEVALGIVVRKGQVLICQRADHAHLGGLWEFPGGKREAGESIEACLVRELEEELMIRVTPTSALQPIDHDYPDRTVRLFPYLCTPVGAAEPRPMASQRVEWVEPAELRRRAFPPANAELIETIVARVSRATTPD